MAGLSVGEMILRARGTRSQREIANAVDVTPSYVSKLERGENPPSDALCIKLAGALDLNEAEGKELRLRALEERESIDARSLFPSGLESSIPQWNKEEQKFMEAFSELDDNWRRIVLELVLQATEYTHTKMEEELSSS